MRVTEAGKGWRGYTGLQRRGDGGVPQWPCVPSSAPRSPCALASQWTSWCQSALPSSSTSPAPPPLCMAHIFILSYKSFHLLACIVSEAHMEYHFRYCFNASSQLRWCWCKREVLRWCWCLSIEMALVSLNTVCSTTGAMLY